MVAAVEASYAEVSECQVKIFVLWRVTCEAEFSGTSVGPVFFARGGILKNQASLSLQTFETSDAL